MFKHFSWPGSRARVCCAAFLLWAALVGGAHAAKAADFVYIVQPGDHPWNLAQRFLSHPSLSQKLLARNKLEDAHRLTPGTRLKIPQEWLRLESAAFRVEAVVGEATLVQGHTEPRVVQVGDLLRAPSLLITGANGSVSLAFADSTRVQVRRDTQLLVQQAQMRLIDQARFVVLTLLQGNVESEVAPLGHLGGRFEIHSPAAVAAVRGTSFRTRSRDDALRTEVLTGAVAVGSPKGQVMSRANQGSVARQGEAPDAPVALLPAPDLTDLPEQIERMPINLSFSALEGASGYRTQISATDDFGTLVSDETSTVARVRAREVADGRYFVRVRAIDANELEGRSAQRMVVVHTQPEPPMLIEPPADAVVLAERPTFKWTQGEAVSRYRLQILADDGTTVLDDQTVSGTTAQVTPSLSPGKYLWRVATIDPTKPAKPQGPWGDAMAFRRVLPAPGVEIPRPKDGVLSFRWTAQPQAASYRLQVAREDTFDRPLVDVSTEGAQYLLQDLAPGLYFVRVQAMGVDGYVGPWGAPKSFSMPEASQPWRVLLMLVPLLAIF